MKNKSIQTTLIEHLFSHEKLGEIQYIYICFKKVI